MTNFVEKDENGKVIYRGFISLEEKEKADRLLALLQDEIPKLGEDLRGKYGDTVLYKYYLGKRLGELLEEYEIPEKTRMYFWNEIKQFAAEKERKRTGGDKKSKTRNFYEQCYQLSLIDLGIVEKYTWDKWSSLLDRVTNREDNRLFTWMGTKEEKIKRDPWRSFEKALNLFLKNKDTSVFDDDELFSIYDMLLNMGEQWNFLFNEFAEQYPTSQKIKTKAKWEKKFYDLCFKSRKANKRNIDEADCKIIFDSIMKSGMKA